MMSASDLYSSIKSNLADRVRSPFYGSFIISWVVINWKPILIFLLSKKNIYTVINDLSAYCDVRYQLYYPVAATLFLVFIMPVIAASYSFFHSWVSNISDSGNDFKKWLNEKTVKKRNSKLEYMQKIHAGKMAEADLAIDKIKTEAEAAIAERKAAAEAAIAESKAKEDRSRLISEMSLHDIADLPSLKDELDRLHNANALLQEANDDLLYKLKRLYSGEKPSSEHMPSGLRPGGQMQFHTEAEMMKLERESKNKQPDDT